MVQLDYLTGWFFFLFNVDGPFQFITGVYVFIILGPPTLPRSERHCSPEIREEGGAEEGREKCRTAGAE
jgi:hypothetical protein